MRTSIVGSVVVAALAAAAQAQINVSPGNMNGWQVFTFDDGTNPNSASVTFMNGIGTPPLGSGSVQLATGAYGDGAARVATRNFDGTPLASISAMTYSSYSQNASYSGLHTYLSLRVDYNNDGAEDDIIFFEPEYQNGYTGAVPTQADATTGLWQGWNALAGGWWSNSNVLGTGNAGADVRPLADFIAAFPNAVIAGDMAPGLRFTAGFGAPTWNDYVGYLDNFSITLTGGPAVTYDFEAAPTPGAAALFGLGGLAAFRRRR
ncbi:MAG: hypothetical protein QM783_15155 [Phycisphaerales bacterium]